MSGSEIQKDCKKDFDKYWQILKKVSFSLSHLEAQEISPDAVDFVHVIVDSVFLLCCLFPSQQRVKGIPYLN